MSISSQYPYNDRFDTKKNYSKVLFNPNRPLQQSELNELQSVIRSDIQRLGDGVFTEGALIEGMAFQILEDENEIKIEAGLLYLAGKVRTFEGATIPFTGVETEEIGVYVEKTIVTAEDDEALRDQTVGADSYLSAGSDRLKETVHLTMNDEDNPVIYEFRDGKLFLEKTRPEYAFIHDILAERTHDESGSFQVSGFDVWTQKSEDDTMIDLIIDEGKAYVLGYQVKKPNSTRVQIDKSTTTAKVTRETHTYRTKDRKNVVNSSSIKDITEVYARTESPSAGITISKGATKTRDSLPTQYTSIDRGSTILSTTAPAITYEYGKDYTIVEEDGVQYVDWDTGLNVQEPSTGSSYNIKFEYDRRMKLGTDYKVTTAPQGDDRPGWVTTIDFNGLSGSKPKDGGLMTVDYTFYLHRRDLIRLTPSGEFIISEGEPGSLQSASPPDSEDPMTLIIGIVLVYPNSDKALGENQAVKRLRMEDLQKMKTRLENVEHNQAIQQLENSATITDNPLHLRGVFADGFTDFSRMDKNLSTVSFSFEDASITLRTDSPDDQKYRPEISNESTIHTWGRLVSAPFTERREAHQMLATEAWNVNPYAVYNKQGVLKLTPEADNWIEEEKITIHEEDHVSADINRWWRHQKPGDPNGKLSEANQHLIDNTTLLGDIQWGGKGGRVSATNPTGIGAEIDGLMFSTAQETREHAIEYMRRIDLEFTATNLLPMSNNLELTFDGMTVAVEPTGTTVKGTESGTLRSNARGEATGKFRIPQDIRTGTREATLQNTDNLASATFTAQGTKKITEETITKTRVTFNLYDPLAQSFAFPSDRVVTSIESYFASKPTDDNLIVQIRGLSEGGYPNRTVYAERLMEPKDINVSDDASKATKIFLDDPLMVKAGENYCMVFITDSMDYTMWVATLGEPLINNPASTVNAQPYVNGVLFSSSNAVTWTAHQKSNLKFAVNTAIFQENAVIEFDVMEEMSSDRILLMSTFLTPGNTGCYWEVRVIAEEDIGRVNMEDMPWQPLYNYLEIDTSFVIGQAQLRATFEANRYISPFLAMDDLMFVNFVTATTGDYVSKNIDLTEAPYNQLTFAYDGFIPPGGSITPYYSTNGGTSWTEITETPDVSYANSEFPRYTYKVRVSSRPTTTQGKFKLTLTGENRFSRPRARRLTAVMKDEIFD